MKKKIAVTGCVNHEKFSVGKISPYNIPLFPSFRFVPSTPGSPRIKLQDTFERKDAICAKHKKCEEHLLMDFLF